MFQNIPPGRVFGLDMQTLISIGVHLINLAVLAFLMSRLLYKPVRDFMFKRTARVSEQLMRAREDMEDAADLKLQYEEKLSDIAREREDMIAAAKKQAAEQYESLMVEAEKEAEAIKAAAEDEIELEKKRMQEEMKQVIFEISSAMAEKYVALSLDETAHAQLFDQTIAELEEASWWK